VGSSSVKIRALAVLTTAALAASVALVSAAQATATVKVVRLGGADRYQTAQILAEHAFPNGTPYAILARGQDFAGGSKGFADALAGNFLAGYFGGPILLTDGSTVPAATLHALQDLKVKYVGMLGGTFAIAGSVVSALDATPSTNSAGGNIVVNRIAGADRYQTAAMAAELVPVSFVRTVGGVPTALIARGDDFPDALAGGPLADAAHLPLILTNPQSLNPSAAQALQALGIKSALILGGTSAMSSATEQAIQALGIATQRLAGATRQQTATAIATYAIANLGFSNSVVDLARGDAYPDALSGGPEAGQAGPAPILLTASPTSLGGDALTFLQSALSTLGEVDLLGLQGAISDSVLGEINALFATTTTTTPGSSTTGLLPGLPGLNIPGLGALLGQLSLAQQQSLLPTLTALPASVLGLIGGLVQNVPGAKLGGVATLLGQPPAFVSALTSLVPALPSGGLPGLGGVLSILPVGQVAPVAQLLSGLPAGSSAPLASLLTALPAAQLGPLGSLLGAANPTQLGVIGQVLTGVTGGLLGSLLNSLLGQLTGLPGVSVLTSLSPANAGLLNTLLGTLSGGQVALLGGVLSGVGASPANVLGTFLGGLGVGGAAGLGGVLGALPVGQGAALGGILSGLTPQGGSALGSLLVGTPPSSVPGVHAVLAALP
jgi:putative cell wall-binding protein